jgi:hypothetical protein
MFNIKSKINITQHFLKMHINDFFFCTLMHAYYSNFKFIETLFFTLHLIKYFIYN